MSKYEYMVIIEPAEEGGYLARVPALVYLTTEGETIEETRAMAEDAIKGYLQTLKAEKLPIPQDFMKEQPHIQKLAVSV